MKKFLSIVIALSLCVSCFIFSSAAAFIYGDVDGNGSVTAADARLALRASVNLEKLSDTQKKAADVDKNPGVTAADARLILRASVGLETLHTHSYTSVVTKNATCTADGEITKTCECGEIIKERVAATGHKLKEMKITKPASASAYGEASFDCSSCSEKVTLTLCTHTASQLKIDSITSCSVSGCKGQFPSFNLLVNQLKSPGSNNRQNGFSITKATTQKAKATYSNILNLGLAKIFQEMLNGEITEGTETEYSEFISNRHVNSQTFNVKGKSYVSDLKDGEVKSITIKKINNVDFLKNLPSSYTATASGRKVDLSSIKSIATGNVYKISVTLKPETCSTKNYPAENSPIERIVQSDFNDGLVKNLDSLKDIFADSPEMANFLSMDTIMTTDCTVDYYFTTDTFEPVCAHYNYVVDTDNKTYVLVNDDGEKQKEPSVTITIEADVSTDTYYFFNEHFEG